MMRTIATDLGIKLLSQQFTRRSGVSFLSEPSASSQPLGLLRQVQWGNAGARWNSTLGQTYGSQQQQEQEQHEAQQAAKADVMLGSEHDVAAHPGLKKDTVAQCYLMSSPTYTKDYMESVLPTHKPVKGLSDRIGFAAVNTMRGAFDLATGYGHGKMTEAKWLRRVIFLETVAGVPGMVAGMLRHMRSLRTMKRDYGWIHTLLEESENERMHLLTFMQLREPSWMFRGMVLLTQGIFFNLFFIVYLISPKVCHAFVGYLEEEAVKTYTHLLEEIDAGRVWKDKPAPQIAIDYWKLGQKATMRDVALAVRADEACHAHVNHTFSDMKPDEPNPFVPGGKTVMP